MIKSLEYFRAIAIIFIVAGHFFPVTGVEASNLFELTIQNIIFGGTTLFVFISGFLFHHVFYKNFSYGQFLRKKVKVIVLPYLFFSLIPIIYYSMKNINAHLYFDIQVVNYFSLAFKYFITGSSLQIYWYIPFIMLVFLLSPLHIRFIKVNFGSKLVVVTIMVVISIFLHRSIGNYNILHNFIYFAPIYLIGIMASIYKSRIYKFFNGKEYYILALVFSLAFFQAYNGDVGSYHKAPFQYDGVDLMLLQKLSLSLFFMLWLHNFERTRNKFLEFIAATSFTIYFMHAFLLWVISSFNFRFDGNWVEYIVLVAFIIMLCSATAFITKKGFKKRSRYIIGF